MGHVSCYDSNGALLTHFYQWDTDQKLIVKGLDQYSSTVLHFCNRNSNVALVVPTTQVVENGVTVGLSANIPNILLQQADPLFVYIYGETDNGGYRTYHVIHIPVRPRAKPGDYEYEDNIEYLSAVILNSRLNELINELSNQETPNVAPEVIDIRVGHDGTVYTTAGDAVRALGAMIDELRENIDDYIDAKAVNGLLYENNMLYLTSNGEIVSDGVEIVGGGGGGSGNNATLTVTNTTGWLAKTISSEANCVLSFLWSSIEGGLDTGDGTLTVSVDDLVKRTSGISQGATSVDVTKYLSSGINRVRLTVTDVYGNRLSLNFTITVISLTITSSFDSTIIYEAGNSIAYTYTANGAVRKTVYFVVDGATVGTDTVTTSGRQQTHLLNGLTHGAHSLRVYFTATINEEPVTSNELYYELIVVDPLSSVPIIASTFNSTSVTQYTNLLIPYRVYSPDSLTSDISLYANSEEVASLNVDRTEHTWSYSASSTGELTLSISCGATTRAFHIVVEESDIDVEAETDALALHLTSYGRSNNEQDPSVWRDALNNVSCTLSGFNFVSNGWVTDDDGITVLRVSGDARVSIPYQPFASDFRSTGKTIEIEFATRDTTDYNTPVLSCMSGGRGFQLTPQRALLASEQTNISTQYKENEHIRIAFVAEKRTENRLLYVYINGIASGVVQYSDNDDFSQVAPVGINIGSSGCTTDVYCIRVYDNNLTRYQLLDNWIADTQDSATLFARYEHNNIYDEYGNIVIDKLPGDLPYMVISCAELPQYKGDKKTVSGYYVDPQDSGNSFTFTGCQANVQGTSSAVYVRKNYDLQFKSGFELGSGHADNYALTPSTIPFNRFVLKADVASSEGANNVELVRLYNDACIYKTPEMTLNSKVRWGIDGFPIVVFWHDTNTNNVSFLGKYNFNLPKRAPAPYGYANDDTMESWEFQNNTSLLMLFQSDYFDETPYTDPSTGDTKELWRYDYEARFPSDEWTDYSILQEFQSFIYSTYRAEATGDVLNESVSYDGVEYTHDTAAYRLAKFRAEFPTYAELNSFLFYYIFTELFLMVDNRAKNLFIGFNGSQITAPNRIATRKATAQPYDFDTAIGTNNEGTLTFGYSLEDIDHLAGGAKVFNGQDSVLWTNIRDAYSSEITQMYQDLRSAGVLSYDTVESRYETHQSKWPEAIFNEDAYFKYIAPLTDPDQGNEPTATYLPMMQGSKAEQRKWWLYNRFRYLDSKWGAGHAASEIIELRGYAKADITVTPYADIYPTVKYASYTVQDRGHAGTPTTLACPLATVNDTEIHIYSASQIASVGDLSGLKVGRADFSSATKLQSIIVGSGAQGYENPNLTSEYLKVGTNKLLSMIDARNCTALTGAIDLSGCANIEHIYFDGSNIASCLLPDGGIIKTLHLPGSITNLTIRNQKGITSFDMPSYTNITTLRIENTPNIDVEEIISGATNLNRLRLIGVDWEFDDASFVLSLRGYGGVDEHGYNTPTAQISGDCYIQSITGAEYAQIRAAFPYLNITYGGTLTSTVYFMSDDGNVQIATATSIDGASVIYSGEIPTKPSTAQYSFTFDGWSSTLGGSVDNNALNNVYGDRIVYAHFAATIRKYSVYFYNGDQLLETVNNIPYGTSTSYSGDTSQIFKTGVEDPENYEFIGWNPPPTNITGDTNCYAQFIYASEITDSWDTISLYSSQGVAQNYYSIGYCKRVQLQGNIGIEPINTELYAFIIGFDHNSPVEGSGVSFGCFRTGAEPGDKDVCLVGSDYSSSVTDTSKSFNISHRGSYNYGGWGACDMRYDILGSTNVAPSGYGATPTTGKVGYSATSSCATSPVNNTLMSCLPADLRAVMKGIIKYTDNNGYSNYTDGSYDAAQCVTSMVDYLPLLSEYEIYGRISYSNPNEASHQAQYTFYANGNSRIRYSHTANNTSVGWWQRSPRHGIVNGFCIVNTSGATYNSDVQISLGVAPVFLV